jgi:iron complex transport system ATP-binding protein
MILVTHHVEEIPLGISHALLLSEGKVVAQGLIEDVLTSQNLSQAFALDLLVEHEDGRYFARAR